MRAWLRAEAADIAYGFTHAPSVLRDNVADLLRWIRSHLAIG